MTQLEPADKAWIDNQSALDRFLGAIASAPWLVLDTEFLRTRTYYPQLCLIQISDGTHHGLVDLLAELDLEALIAQLRNRRPLVLHACLQDIEALHHDFDLIPPEVFDTQIAWGLLGREFQVSYTAMVKQHLDIELDKSQVRSRWDRRPLSKAQLRYALSDVLHLAPVYESLRDELEAQNRSEWLREEIKRLLVPETWTPDLNEAWRRIRGDYRQFDGTQLGALRALAAWREQKARDHDCARNFLLQDELLITLAQNPQMKRKEFEPTVSRHLPPTLKEELWQALQQIQDSPPILRTQRKTQQERREIRHQIQALGKLTRDIAAELSIAPELLATRSMLEEFLEQREQSIVLQGWRRACVGDPLMEAVDAL